MKPIAWYDPTNGVVSTDKDSPLFTPLGQVLPLYAQRTWVGLTDQEIGQVFQEKCTEHGQLLNERAFRIAARWAEEKLKEKNT